MQPPPGVKLTWTNNSVSATSFTIQRATDAGFTTGLTTFNYTLNSLPPAMDGPIFPTGTTTYSDTTVAAATPYYYRVAATKTFPIKQSPTWDAPGTAGAVVTEQAEFHLAHDLRLITVSGNILVSSAFRVIGNMAANFISTTYFHSQKQRRRRITYNHIRNDPTGTDLSDVQCH